MDNEARAKRVVAIGDLHCGQYFGLTPPDWQGAFPHTDDYRKVSDFSEQTWQFYADTINALKPIDCLIVNGDCVDGPGEIEKGREHLTTDVNEQIEMAVAAIQFAEAKSIQMTYGSGYHTGKGMDWEKIVADKVGGNVKNHNFVDVNGCIFDVKHKIGSSSTPYGRGTPLGKIDVWNLLWAESERQPRSDVFLRSHVHYCVGTFRPVGTKIKLMMTLPALQGWTIYGARNFDGIVNHGLVSFDVTEDGECSMPLVHCADSLPCMRVNAAVV